MLTTELWNFFQSLTLGVGTGVCSDIKKILPDFQELWFMWSFLALTSVWPRQVRDHFPAERRYKHLGVLFYFFPMARAQCSHMRSSGSSSGVDSSPGGFRASKIETRFSFSFLFFSLGLCLSSISAHPVAGNHPSVWLCPTLYFSFCLTAVIQLLWCTLNTSQAFQPIAQTTEQDIL